MKKNFGFFLALGLTLGASLAWGAEHGESAGLDDHQIRVIIYQTINVTIMFVGLFYFLRKPVKTYFQDKKRVFQAEAEKAHALRKAAEEERMDIHVRLTNLESTADESVARARAEAAEMKNQLIQEAHNLSKKIHEEAAIAAKLESEKAKHRLREQMIKDATEAARQQIQTSVSAEDQKRLQSDFIENVRLVQP